MTGALTFWSQISKQLMGDEGYRGHPYKDQVGKATVGYGRNLDAKGITETEAQFLLSNDVDEVQALLRTRLPWTMQLDDARLGVLVNMAFNMGFDGLLGFRGMLSAAQTQDWNKAAAEMEDSAWYRQVGARAARLVKQMQTGVWQFNQ